MIVNDGSDNAFTKHTYSSRFEGFTDLSESEYVTKCFDNAEEFWIKEVKHSAFGTGRVFKKELFSSVRFPKSGLDDERTTYKLVYQCKKISTMNFGLYYWFQNPKSYMNNISVDKLMDAILSTREPLDFYYENKYPLSFKDQLNYYLWIVCDRMYTYGWKRSFRSEYKEQFDFINGILICRVTAPTKGDIYMNGRLTSMLEVGTGFHDELTGRENVYLNGAILGMTKQEIDNKFDEIVEFSEVGQFIDTPVKRYSSGMKVKLGFSVASHLNSEIMIMDEVLAVGDVNFQNKCINRMRKVAEEEGKTILYVSHNMATVKSLCDRCVVLSHGQKAFDGSVEDAIAIYMKEDMPNQLLFYATDEQRDYKCNLRHKIICSELIDLDSNIIDYGNKFMFRLRWNSENNKERVLFKCVLYKADRTAVGVVFGGELIKKLEIIMLTFFSIRNT